MYGSWLTYIFIYTWYIYVCFFLACTLISYSSFRKEPSSTHLGLASLTLLLIWQNSTQNGSTRRAMMAFQTNHTNLPVNRQKCSYSSPLCRVYRDLLLCPFLSVSLALPSSLTSRIAVSTTSSYGDTFHNLNRFSRTRSSTRTQTQTLPPCSHSLRFQRVRQTSMRKYLGTWNSFFLFFSLNVWKIAKIPIVVGSRYVVSSTKPHQGGVYPYISTINPTNFHEGYTYIHTDKQMNKCFIYIYICIYSRCISYKLETGPKLHPECFLCLVSYPCVIPAWGKRLP